MARPSGDLVLLKEGADKPVALSHPDGAAQKAARFADEHAAALASGAPVFVAGTRAGYEIDELHRRTRRRDWEPAQPIYIYEEDERIVRLLFTAQDWTGRLDERAHFFLGANAADECRAFFTERLARPVPDELLTLGDAQAAARAASALRAAKTEILRAAQQWKSEADAYYEKLGAADLARAFLDWNGARFLLVSNRQTYFVRYSVRDLRDALEHGGAEVRVLEEEDAADRLTGPVLLRALAAFRPHALFFIDHLRAEGAGIYPPQLPFVAYIQDYMQSVFNEKAGAAITPRDLVIGYARDLEAFGFPPDRLFVLPPLTNPRMFAPSSSPPPEKFAADLSFVSNRSATHEEAYEGVAREFKDAPVFARIAERVYGEALARFESGAFYEDYRAFHHVVADALAADGFDPAAHEPFIFRLFDSFADAMLREQSLRWAAESGRPLALWGRGWERHPRLGGFARGVVENGPDLAAIYRASKINLHVNQFELEHVRLVDGLAAGGFSRAPPAVRRMAPDGRLPFRHAG
ncbi:MAG: hypothetical protein M5R36_18405 [Deltaproteobacteria bacterium]|nr:hypothetical protein [Deltaproteobacteria bacterium]